MDFDRFLIPPSPFPQLTNIDLGGFVIPRTPLPFVLGWHQGAENCSENTGNDRQDEHRGDWRDHPLDHKNDHRHKRHFYILNHNFVIVLHAHSSLLVVRLTLRDLLPVRFFSFISEGAWVINQSTSLWVTCCSAHLQIHTTGGFLIPPLPFASSVRVAALG